MTDQIISPFSEGTRIRLWIFEKRAENVAVGTFPKIKIRLSWILFMDFVDSEKLLLITRLALQRAS